MRILNLDFHALIGNIHAAAQTEDARILKLFELTFLVWLDWLKRHGVVKLRHRVLIELTIAQMQFAGEGHHMHPAFRPGRLVVLLGIAEPGDHHGLLVGSILSRRGSGARDSLRGVEFKTRIQLGKGGFYLKFEGFRVELTHNITALVDVEVLLPHRF